MCGGNSSGCTPACIGNYVNVPYHASAKKMADWTWTHLQGMVSAIHGPRDYIPSKESMKGLVSPAVSCGLLQLEPSIRVQAKEVVLAPAYFS